MRWEDERYVRVYTRDTGDWLALSFEAQAVFLMLLRKVDRIGELHLGKRGRSAIPACIGHGGKPIDAAVEELLADGCVRLDEAGDRLFIPNFLIAQEVAKSPADRKREQRERDASQIRERTQLSRDVTDVTFGHEMSRSAVPSRAVPNPPNHALKPAGVSAKPPAPGRRAPRDKPAPDPRHAPLRLRLEATFLAVTGAAYAMDGWGAKAVSTLLGRGTDDEVDSAWGRALRHTGFPTVRTLPELVERWAHFVGTGPSRAAGPPRGAATAADKDWSGPVKTIQTEYGEELDLGAVGR